MKRYVWKSLTGQWISSTSEPQMYYRNFRGDTTFHDTWEEAYITAYTMTRKELFNL